MRHNSQIQMPIEARQPSLAWRGFLAILLTIGFYGLALGIAGLLLFIVYAEFTYIEHVNARITFFCLAGAGIILWSILPRIDRFVAPGARLLPSKHPALFELIRSIATKTGQKIPAEVYLIPDVNAFVTERGGFLGLGRRRVMGIGLPLLQSLSTSQVKSILAHEFGHFYSGDTSLGPWIYQTRAAIIRTVSGLSQSVLQVPFRWYAMRFLNITQAISRRQETVADVISALVAGKNAAIDALKSVSGLSKAYEAYWQNEILPVFNRGFRPQLASGFDQFTHVQDISNAIQDITRSELTTGKTDSFDSHPSLVERIQAVEKLPYQPVAEITTPAISLVQDVPALEKEMLEKVFGKEKVGVLKPIRWEDVGAQVFLAEWQAIYERYQPSLTGLTPFNLPMYRSLDGALAKQVQQSAKVPIKTQDLQQTVHFILGACLGVLLAKGGWQVEALPGQQITFCKDGKQIVPQMLVQSLLVGKITPDGWQEELRAHGIE